MQTILKAGPAIGACGTFAVFEIIMTCSKLKQGRQAEYDRLTALLEWTRTLGNVRFDDASVSTRSRNQSRSLSWMSVLRVNSGTGNEKVRARPIL
jgi:hypothetical protein